MKAVWFKDLPDGEEFRFWSYRDSPHGVMDGLSNFAKIGPREYVDGDGERYRVFKGKVLVMSWPERSAWAKARSLALAVMS